MERTTVNTVSKNGRDLVWHLFPISEDSNGYLHVESSHIIEALFCVCRPPEVRFLLSRNRIVQNPLADTYSPQY